MISCPVNENFCKDSVKETGQENTSIYVKAFPCRWGQRPTVMRLIGDVTTWLKMNRS